MLHRNILIFAALFLSFPLATAKADDDHLCPVRLVSVHENIISQHTGLIIQQIYQKLGCDVVVTARPGRRAIMEFNHGSFDGEVTRLPVVEKHYTTEFVGSDTPLFEITGSIWAQAGLHDDDISPLGYVRGIVWQENYIAGIPAIGFNTYSEMYESYGRGVIKRLLTPDQHIMLSVKDYVFLEGLEKKKQVFSVSAYHYLEKRYRPFMNRFSDLVAQENFFVEFQK